MSVAQELAEAILDVCGEVPEAGADFAESVREGAVGVGETIDDHGQVSKAQLRALVNWARGLNRWLERVEDGDFVIRGPLIEAEELLETFA